MVEVLRICIFIFCALRQRKFEVKLKRPNNIKHLSVVLFKYNYITSEFCDVKTIIITFYLCDRFVAAVKISTKGKNDGMYFRTQNNRITFTFSIFEIGNKAI